MKGPAGAATKGPPGGGLRLPSGGRRHLTDDGVYLASVRFSISGVYRVIVAKKPAA